MARIKSLVRKLLSKQTTLNLKLRKAVVQGKSRQVAELLDAGASPTWVCEGIDGENMNALLLACQCGNVDVINLLLDAFFEMPHLLRLWGRHMYCIVIRNGNWDAFKRMHERRIPLDPGNENRSKLPTPAFIAAEYGRSEILRFLLKNGDVNAASYSFNGHSLLSIASKNGHYECVEVLISQVMVSDDMLDFAVEVARLHRHAHVVVLLTSCMPEYSSDREPIFRFSSSSSLTKPGEGRGSLAETDILSDMDEDERQRRSSTFFGSDSGDASLYRMDDDAADAHEYEEYLRGLDDSENPEWTSTPPLPFSSPRDEESKTEAHYPPMYQRKWYYHNEVILPYVRSNESDKSSSSSQPKSGGLSIGDGVFYTSPVVTPSASRKVINIRSNSLQSLRSDSFRSLQSLPSIEEQGVTLQITDL